MKKFVLVYYGGFSPQDLSQEQRKDVMEKWGAWFGSIKDSIVDSGNPFGAGMAVRPDAVKAIPADMWPAKGYTIVNAADMDTATAMAKKCPILEEGNEAIVRVYEAMPM